VGTLVTPGEYNGTCASFGPPESTTQMANQSVQLFLHSSRQKVPILYNGRPFLPNYPFLWGDMDPHPSYDSLGPSEPIIHTVSLSVQPFCTDDRTVSLYFTTRRQISPSKLPPSHGGSGPPCNTWFSGPAQVLNPNGISFGSAIFAGLTSHECDRQTD